MEDTAPNQGLPALLIVDDVASNRRYLSGLLSDAGVRIRTAESGPKALRSVAQEEFALIAVVRSIEDFWLTVVRLPRNGSEK